MSPVSPDEEVLEQEDTSKLACAVLIWYLLLSSSARKALKEMDDWLASKRELGKATLAWPPSRLVRRRCLSYLTGEAPSLGVAACIDSSRHLAFAVAKIIFSSTELDHLVRSVFQVLEVLSFLNWSIGALAKKMEDCLLLLED